jgi:hypothetical protein
VSPALINYLSPSCRQKGQSCTDDAVFSVNNYDADKLPTNLIKAGIASGATHCGKNQTARVRA